MSVCSCVRVGDQVMIKPGAGSNQPVLGADPTQPTGRSILGVPLYLQYVAANTLWAVDGSRVWLVVRENVARGGRPVGVLHLRPGRGQSDDAGRVRVRPPAVRCQSHHRSTD